MSALEELCNLAQSKGHDPQEMRVTVQSAAAVGHYDVEDMAAYFLEVIKVYDAIEAKREQRSNEMAKKLQNGVKSASTPMPMKKGMPMKDTPGGKSMKGMPSAHSMKGTPSAHSMKGTPSAHTPDAMPGC